jgi:hypothetical protein
LAVRADAPSGFTNNPPDCSEQDISKLFSGNLSKHLLNRAAENVELG